jgi:hypothetical protein
MNLTGAKNARCVTATCAGTCKGGVSPIPGEKALLFELLLRALSQISEQYGAQSKPFYGGHACWPRFAFCR